MHHVKHLAMRKSKEYMVWENKMEEYYEEQDLGALTSEQIERNELAAEFIGKSKYHLENFERYENGKSKFNTVSFLFSGHWLLFKSMFFYGFLFLAVVVALAFIIPDPYFRAVATGLNIFIGINGNKIYYGYIQKKVDKVLRLYAEQDIRVKEIRKNKRRNLIAGIILFIMFSGITIWGSVYSDNNDNLEVYFEQHEEYRLSDYESIMEKNYLILIDEVNVVSNEEAYKIIEENLIPNQKIILEMNKKISVDDSELMRIHNIYIEAHQNVLKSFTLMSLGYKNNNSTLIDEAFLIIDEAVLLIEEYDNEINKYMGIGLL